MSMWGPKVFDSDGAEDIRDTYRGMLLDKVSDDEAAARILDEFSEELSDPDDGGSFAIALAVTMHKVGRLPEHILTLAIEAIDAGPENWWTEAKDRNARARVLETTRELLMSEQPPPKRLSRPWEENTSLTPGDVLALETDQGYGLLRVARLEKTRFGATPVIVTLNYRGTTLPSADALETIPDLPRRVVWGTSRAPEIYESVGENVFRYRKRDPDFVDTGFTLVGHVAPRPGDEDIFIQRACTWDGAAQYIADGSWFENIAEANAFAEEVEQGWRP
jgi:hypothetical protein